MSKIRKPQDVEGYNSDKQICRQCSHISGEFIETDGMGYCDFLNKHISFHTLEWAYAMDKIMCQGFKVNGGKE